MRNLLEAYQSHDPGLAAFYAGRPEELFAAPASAVKWRTDALDAVNAQYTPFEGFQGDEQVIITGQQAGLFTGPMYTVYKAIGAIQLAQRIEKRTGYPCVPVFWVSTEDHDFDEACTAHFLTKDHEHHIFRYQPGQAVDGFPMYRVPLVSSLHSTIDDLAERVPGSEYRESIRAMLHETLDRSGSVAGWNARLMARLFRETPLRIFLPHLPEVRQAAAWILEREIQEPLTSTRLLNEAGRALERLGFPPQIVKAENECNFFLEMGHRRRKITFENGRFRIPQESMSCDPGEMLTLMNAAPERFSPNVALRCLVQQALFPAAAYIAGPGELAYWAQLKSLFEWTGLPMPHVYPRPRAVLTSAKLNKLLRKSSLTVDELALPQEEVLDKALRRTARDPVLDIVQKHRAELTRLSERFLEEMKQVPAKPDLTDLSEKFVTQTHAGLDRLERRVLQGDTARTETIRKQITRLCTALMPDRKPQERVYSVFSFLFEHGPELIPKLMQTLDIETPGVREIEL